MSDSDLVHRATAQTVTESELRSVVEAISERRGDPYTQLLTIGRACATQYRAIVEAFLESPNDPMLARLALQILCRYWGLAEDYAPHIRRFIKGVEWDNEQDVRVMAISCSDSLLASASHSDLLTSVYNIATDEGEDSVSRQAAYAAIAISCGIRPADLPSPSRFDIAADMKPAILENARLRIERGV